MKKNLVWFMLLVSTLAVAGVTTDQKYIMNKQMGAPAAKVQLGTLVDQAKGAVSVVWNASTTDFGSSTKRTGAPAPRTFGVHTLGAKLPKKSLITRAWVQVTAPVVHFGPGANPGISFNCSTNSISKTTVALNSSSNYQGAVVDGGDLLNLTAADNEDLTLYQRNDSTEDCDLQAQVHGQSASSGEITLFVEYMQIR